MSRLAAANGCTALTLSSMSGREARRNGRIRGNNKFWEEVIAYSP
jgi:hypothetical protein